MGCTFSIGHMYGLHTDQNNSCTFCYETMLNTEGDFIVLLSRDVPEKDIIWMETYVAPNLLSTSQHKWCLHRCGRSQAQWKLAQYWTNNNLGGPFDFKPREPKMHYFQKQFDLWTHQTATYLHTLGQPISDEH